MILITVDMISPDCYKNDRHLSKVIRTPNIDLIAEQGVNFTQAYTTSPLCGPARAAMFTGMHPPYLTNSERAPVGCKTDLSCDDVIFQDYLKAEGYTLKHAGKCHVGVEKFIGTFGENVHAWDRWGPPTMDDDRYIDYLDSMGVLPPRYRRELTGLQADRQTKANSFGGWIEQIDGSDFPTQAHYSTFLADLTIRQIKAALRQAPDQPFFAQLDFFDPHQPYSIPSGFEARYQAIKAAINLPYSYVNRHNDAEPSESTIYPLYQRYWGMYDDELAKDYIAAHLLQVEVVDCAVGILIDYLKSAGLWDECAIVFSADHGDMNTRLGLADKGVYFQPDIFSVPLYIKAPNSYGLVEKCVEQTCSSLDIAPTLLGFAGIKKPLNMEGCDLIPVAVGAEREPLQQVFQLGMHVGMNLGAGIKIDVGQEQWLYGYNASTGYQELYDINQDTQINYFYDTEYDNLRQIAIDQMADVLTSDPRWRGYWASFRLHNADYLDKQACADMQMLKPAV
ncbi:sulfatase-like hydrolase/transferase [Vibrio sp. WXL103]|uniref:sulfatase-like hydrolase/transferase n=1 Tax=Vibrio sp. WXL103 TaxID=3450710 RepID=UPI003EC6ABDF